MKTRSIACLYLCSLWINVWLSLTVWVNIALFSKTLACILNVMIVFRVWFKCCCNFILLSASVEHLSCQYYEGWICPYLIQTWNNPAFLEWYDHVLLDFLFQYYHNTWWCPSKRHKTKELQFSPLGTGIIQSWKKIPQEWIKSTDCYLFRISLADVQMAWWCFESCDFMRDVPTSCTNLNVNMKLPIPDYCIEFIHF